MPEPSPVTKEAFDRLDNRLSEQIKENARHIKQNSESIVKLETLYNTLVKLPDTIASLEKSMLKIDSNMDMMATRINQMTESVQAQKESIRELREENKRQTEAINTVDNKSKIDWAHFLSGNFWSIIWKAVLVASAIIAAYEIIIKS